MPAPKFLAGLPKPLLFALYGAVGGLLGALAFAEPLYRILTPTPPPPPAASEPQLAVAASPAVEVFVDGRNTFPVQIDRAEFDAPVAVRVEGLPTGLTAAPVTIPAGRSAGEVMVVGAATAPPVVSKVAKVVVEAAPGGKKVSAEVQVTFKVTNPPKPLADIVILLDTSVKMQWAIDDLKNGIGSLADSLGKARVDFRLALVTFEERVGTGNRVVVSQFDGDAFTANTTAFRDEVGGLKVTIGTGVDTPQPSLEAVAKSCELPFRKDATKMLLLITDSPPNVRPPSQIPTAVRDTANLIKSANIDAAHLVVWEFDRKDYAPLLDAGTQQGKFFNIKQVVVGDTGFNSLLDTLGTVVSAAAIAKNPDARPQVPSRIEDKPKLSVKSLQSGEQTAAGTEGKQVLRSGVWTAAIAALVCLFLLSGQHHYLRGTLPAVGGALAGLFGGLFVGLVGGAAGQGLYLLIPVVVFQVFGWALLGGMAGMGLALFIPNMKGTHGLLGGAIGGMVGAIGFIAVSKVTGDLVGRLVGGLTLGFCIGLMVAIAETAFRRAWLEVRYGERETITVSLGPEPVKVGSDAKVCTVWARGAPAVALRFFVRDGQVICDDLTTGDEATVSDGFEKEVGTLTVTVHTGSAASAPAPKRRKPVKTAKAANSEGKSEPKPAPTSAAILREDEDDGFDLPMPVAAPAPAKPPAVPPKPPVPGTKAAAPPVPKPPVPKVNPAIKPTATNPNACPSCSRVVAGQPGTRYCMICDLTY